MVEGLFMKNLSLPIAIIVFSTIWGCHMLGDKPPQILTPKNGAEVSEPYPLLAWTPCDSVHHYRLLVGMDKNFQILLEDQFTHETCYRVSDSLKVGETRYWRLSTISQKAVNGPWSGVHSFKRVAKLDTPKVDANESSRF